MPPDHPAPAPVHDPIPATGTYFASPGRLTPEQLEAQIGRLTCNPLLDALLRTVGGLMAVLNEHRQILALNETLLAFLGFREPAQLLGLRLGEAVACPHAAEMPGGCGTSRFCASCGAAIAQAVALNEQRATEHFCAIESVRDGARHDLVLRVRAAPLTLLGEHLILVFVEDVTRQQQSALAERSFHHDLNNTLTALLCASEALKMEPRPADDAELADEVHQLSRQLVREFNLQRQLITAANPDIIQVAKREVRLTDLLATLRAIVRRHPAAAGKQISITPPAEALSLHSDETLILRVVVNMAVNALEATPEGGEIRITVSARDTEIVFRIWNAAAIPPEIALRVFQRNFSTKGTLGRGLGTYSMKLIGERILGGRISFESSPERGTVFQFVLPP